MQQHPIPQNVMTVEFQLIAGLTIRQFAYLAVGGLIDILFFFLAIDNLIKWPVILVISAFFGALAYLPVNDIGLDRWLIAFYRAINSPTKRVWRKEIKVLRVLVEDYARKISWAGNPPPAADRTKLDEYLATLRSGQPKSDLDIAEDSYIRSLPFGENIPMPHSSPTIVAPPELAPAIEKKTVEEDLTQPTPLIPNVKPIITVHMPDKNIYVKKVSTTTVNRQLHSLSSLEGTVVLPIRGETTFEPSEELKTVLAPEQPISEAYQPPIPAAPPIEVAPEVPLIQNQTPPPTPVETPPTSAAEHVGVVQPVIERPEPKKPIIDIHEIERKLAAEAAAARHELLRKAQPAPPVPPPPLPVVVQQPAPPPPVAPPPPPAPAPVVSEAPLPAEEPQTEPPPDLTKKYPDAPPKPTRSGNKGIPATIAIGRMAPSAANVPNVVIGLVRDKTGLLLTDVVIIVKDLEGDPVRALKSNKVGQFAISTPLPNGRYMIDLEKEGYVFDTIAVELDGNIFQPIEVKSK